jgi:hypothetical protein
MSNQSTAGMLLDTIEKMAQEESDKGNLAKGMKTLNTWIETTENHESRQTRQFYGPYMVRLYSLRARLQYDHSNRGSDRKMVEAALKDMQRAEQYFDYYFYGIDPDQKQTYKECIYNMLCDDSSLRRESYARLTDLVKTIPPSPGGVAPSAQEKKASLGGIVEGPLSRIDPKWIELLKPFLIGAGLWTVAILMAGLGSKGQNNPFVFIALVLIIAFLFMSINGWQAFADRGTAGERMKAVLIILLAGTIVGLIPIAYWTGRWVLKKAGKL